MCVELLLAAFRLVGNMGGRLVGVRLAWDHSLIVLLNAALRFGTNRSFMLHGRPVCRSAAFVL